MLTADKDIGVVEKLWRRYATGAEGFMAVADWLNAEGHRTAGGQLFSRESVRTLLKNRAYCGYVSSGGEEHRGLHGELFADAADLWAHNQALMEERTGGTTRASDLAPAAWLVGRVWCEHCRKEHDGVPQKLWHRTSPGPDGVKRRYYRCSGFDKRVHRDADMLPAAALEAQARNLLGALDIPADLLPPIIERARATVAERMKPTRPTLNPAQLQLQIERLGEAYADGALSRERYQRRLNDLKAQLTEASQQLPDLDLNERRALALLREVPALIASATPDHLRQLVTAVFSRVSVLDYNIVAVTPRADLYALLAARSNTMGWSEKSDQPK